MLKRVESAGDEIEKNEYDVTVPLLIFDLYSMCNIMECEHGTRHDGSDFDNCRELTVERLSRSPSL